MPESKTPIGRRVHRGIVRAHGSSRTCGYPGRRVGVLERGTARRARDRRGAPRRRRRRRRRVRDAGRDDPDGRRRLDRGDALRFPTAPPPAGGWPALVFLHGLGQTRSDMSALGEGYGHRRAVRRPHLRRARPRGVGRARRDRRPDGDRRHAGRLATGSRDRPDVADTTDRRAGASRTAAARSGTRSSPACRGPRSSPSRPGPTSTPRSCRRASSSPASIAGLPRVARPEARRPRRCSPLQRRRLRREPRGRAALGRRALEPLEARGVTTPVFMVQGRRDFALRHRAGARAPTGRSQGPKVLYVGLHGHAPSTFPAADTAAMLAEGARWFDCYLRGDTASPRPEPVAIAPENWTGQPSRGSPALPKIVARRPFAFPGVTTFAAGGQGRAHAPLPLRQRDRGLRLADGAT